MNEDELKKSHEIYRDVYKILQEYEGEDTIGIIYSLMNVCATICVCCSESDSEFKKLKKHTLNKFIELMQHAKNKIDMDDAL